MPGNYFLGTLLPSIISGFLIWAWSLKWPGKPHYPDSEESKPQAKTAAIVLLFTFAMVGCSIFLSPGSYGSSTQRDYSFWDVIGQVVLWAIGFKPRFLGMKIFALGWRDLQYRRTNLFSSLALGILIGVVFLVSAGKAQKVSMLFTANAIAAGLQYLVVGFAEEILFRGYIQVRWVAALGWWPGFLLSSLVMSLVHIPILCMGDGLPLTSAI